MITSPERQKGVALIVSLLMLVLLTMLATTAIRNSNVNLRITGNQAASDEVASVVAQGVEMVLSDISYFNDPSAEKIAVTQSQSVSVDKPDCVAARPATGYSARWNLTPRDTTWEVRAERTAGTGGAKAAMVQGVNIRMTKGSCS